MTNPNDIVRSQILQYFYDRNLSATSRFGKKGSAAKISDVKRELKDKHNLTQQQVISNLTYQLDLNRHSAAILKAATKCSAEIEKAVDKYVLAVPQALQSDEAQRKTGLTIREAAGSSLRRLREAITKEVVAPGDAV